MTDYNQIRVRRHTEEVAAQDYERDLAEQRRAIGLEMHATDTAIHVGRQALTELRQQEPPDETAIAEQRAQLTLPPLFATITKL